MTSHFPHDATSLPHIFTRPAMCGMRGMWTSPSEWVTFGLWQRPFVFSSPTHLCFRASTSCKLEWASGCLNLAEPRDLMAWIVCFPLLQSVINHGPTIQQVWYDLNGAERNAVPPAGVEDSLCSKHDGLRAHGPGLVALRLVLWTRTGYEYLESRQHEVQVCWASASTRAVTGKV